MEFRILGSFEVVHDGRVISVGGARQQALVALLALRAPTPVGFEQLIDELWGSRPPHGAPRAIQVYISRIRAGLRAGGAAQEVLRTCPSSYALDVPPDRIDARRFERLIHDGRRLAADDPRRARQLLEEALALWRGRPFAQIEHSADTELEADRLDELRLGATECVLDMRLAGGEHVELTGTLQGLVVRHPLREQLRRQLMLALYRGGRQTEALAAYHDARAALDELGLLPGPELRGLQQAILRHEDWLELGPPPAGERGAFDGRLPPTRFTRPVVDELPMVGRAEPLARLVASLESPPDGERTRMAIVCGEAGVGKTRLLRELAAWAATNDCIVAATSAADDDVLPYRPFCELVRAVVGCGRGDAYLEQLGSLAGDLALLVPELAASPPPSGDPGLTRTRMFDAVVGLVAIAATERPLAILIDDADSMGRATGALVRALLGSCHDRRVAVVLAARERQPHAGSGLHDVLRHFDATPIELRGLSERDLATWLRCAGEQTSERRWPGTGAQLHARTGGVPLLVQAALSEAAPLQGATDRVRLDGLVAERRAALTPQANAVLDVAAVAGVDIEPQLIAAVSGLDADAVHQGLRQIVRARGLLVAGAAADDYAWHHALVREAVLGSIPLGRQTRWREECSGVLSGRGLGLRAARHAIAAVQGQARGILATVLQGVDEAIALLAFETGEDLCRRALGLAGPDADADVAVALRGRLGLCLALTGQRQAADETWREAAACARQARRPDLLARAALATEPLGRAIADTPLRWELLREAVATPDLEPRLHIELSCAWLEEAVMPRHAIAAPELASRVVRDARRHGELALVLRALKSAYSVARATRRVDRELSDELCTLADRLGDAEWQAYAQLVAFIDALTMLDRQSAEHHLERLLEVGSRAPSPRLRWNAAFVRATWELLQGDLESSDTHARAAAELGHRCGMADAALAMAVHGFLVAYHAGMLAGASHLLAAHAAAHPELPAFAAGAGLAFAAAGDLETARAIRDRLFPAIAAPGVDETWPVAACLTAQLCFETDAPAGQCLPLRAALQTYPGRLAVLGGGSAECGPVQRYIGLLTAATDPVHAVALLRSAASECQQFGASIWTRRIDADIAAVPHAMSITTIGG